LKTKPETSLRQRGKGRIRFDSVAQGMVFVAGATQVSMMVMMTAHVIARKLGMPIPGALEASEQLMVVVFSFPLAAIGLRRAHIVFDLFTTRLPSRIRAKLELVGDIAGALLFGLLGLKAWHIAWNNYLIGEYTKGVLDFRIWPFRFALALGLSVFSAQLILSVYRGIKRSGGREEV
jgi:TRAP-type C4-dicarboxylate transport system permease small subunit